MGTRPEPRSMLEPAERDGPGLNGEALLAGKSLGRNVGDRSGVNLGARGKARAPGKSLGAGGQPKRQGRAKAQWNSISTREGPRRQGEPKCQGRA
jgi:hypothetical protein